MKHMLSKQTLQRILPRRVRGWLDRVVFRAHRNREGWIIGPDGNRNYCWFLFGLVVSHDGFHAWQLAVGSLHLAWGFVPQKREGCGACGDGCPGQVCQVLQDSPPIAVPTTTVPVASLRLLAQTWRMQNGDYPESKDDCADDLITLIEAPNSELTGL